MCQHFCITAVGVDRGMPVMYGHQGVASFRCFKVQTFKAIVLKPLEKSKSPLQNAFDQVKD